MSIVGVDLGYTYTKNSSMNIFPSKCTKSEPILGGTKISINGDTYFVGDGESTVELNKIDHDITKSCLMYSLTNCFDGSPFDIVTGLPISQYKNQKDSFKEMINKNRRNHVLINGVEIPITIRNVEIYPQGAGALYSQCIFDDAIIIDIGGRTVDIAYFDISEHKRKLVKSNTLFDGMLVLYSKIITQVNNKYELTLPADYAEKILLNGLTVDGEKQDISFLKPTISEHVNRIFEEVRLNYPHTTTTIYLCGGGSKLLKNAFSKRFKNIVLMDNSQFANAIGFKKVGESIWKTNR